MTTPDTESDAPTPQAAPGSGERMPKPDELRAFQFSLASIFVVMTAVAIVLSIFIMLAGCLA